MVRIILFLVLIGALGLGAAWIADQNGEVVVVWGDWRANPTVPRAVLILAVTVAALMALWSILSGLLRLPRRMRRAARARSEARGREAIRRGLIAIGSGDQDAARKHAGVAARHAQDDPLTLMLAAQSAQMAGDRDGAHRAFYAMAERADTRLLGLRGLFIEAQRNDDALGAVAAAEEALKVAPQTTWASHAVLGFRCSQADWSGALNIVERNYASGAIDKTQYRRQRAVLLTARALEVETSDRDASRATVMEAVKLAPTLIPAATLAAKFLSEGQQTRKAMQIIEAAWQAQPHPDLADAYAHVRLGDSALERLRRIERLAERTPGHVEGALGIARVAADAREYARARAALAPLVDKPTQRVALLMAEVERGEFDDEGAARAWTLRAVHAAHDPEWTADGYVSDRWRPVSPVTGRLDAFQWMVPVAALPSSSPATDLARAIPIPPRPVPVEAPPMREIEPPAPPAAEAAAAAPAAVEIAKQDNVRQDTASTQAEPPPPEPPPPPPPPPAPVAEVPVFRPRTGPDFRSRPLTPAIPTVIPLVRAPDDPGVSDAPEDDETAAQGDRGAQAGGFRGFWSRLVR
jgi:HemY protein